MPDYKNGRVYTVRCRTDNNLIYVGSTTTPISKRFSSHKKNKTCSLYKYVQEYFDGDWTHWYIELYEECEYDNIEQLKKREGEIQREIATINRNKAGRTIREYYIDNKEKLLEYQNQYNLNNKDKLLEYQKQYNLNNKEKRLEYQNQYNKVKRNNLCKV